MFKILKQPHRFALILDGVGQYLGSFKDATPE